MPETRKEPSTNHEGDEVRSGEEMRAKLSRQLDEDRETFVAPPIADHTLIHRIGSGSYGDVWLARSALGTLRAVKIVYRERFKDDRPYEREFSGILKYEPISRTHEGLVQVLHVGRNDAVGCFYYVMELADDASTGGRPGAITVGRNFSSYRARTLGSELSRHDRLRPSEAANLALRLARALGHLHQSGLVHRDIKPSNVIFVGGQPKLADIGLVTDVGSSRSFVGTEGFIPPEGPGTRQADLYGLGKLLYELATGRDRMDFPQLPPQALYLPEGEALLELNEVITRACAPDVHERYATATELEADLNSFLAGRSLRRARNLERYMARSKRMGAAVCVLFAIFALALWVAKREERHARDTARSAIERALEEAKNRAKETTLRLRAEAAEVEAVQQLYTALLEQARARVRSGELGQRVGTLDAVRRAAAISNRVELRREAIAALALPDLRFQEETPFGEEYTLRLLDPAFERIAVCRGRGSVEIRAFPNDRLLGTLPASTNLVAYGGTWSHDGRFLAVKRDHESGVNSGVVEVWEVNTGRRAALIPDALANARTFHPHEPRLQIAETDGWIRVWDLKEGIEAGERQVDFRADNLAYSPDGKLVAASYRVPQGWRVSVYEAEDAAPVTAAVITNFVSTLAWQTDGRRIAATDYGGKVYLIDARTGKVQILGQHKAEAATAVLNPAGDYLFTGGWERELICWDVRTMRQALTIAVDSYVAQFRKDGKACVLFTKSGMRTYQFEIPTAHREMYPEAGPRVRHAVFSPDGKWFAASAGRWVGVWDPADGAGTLTRDGVEAQLFWSPDSQELYGSSRNDNGYRWKVQRPGEPSMPPALERLNLGRPEGFASLSLFSNLITWTTSKGSRVAGLDDLNSEDESWTETAPGMSRVSPDGKWLMIFRAYGRILHVYRFPSLEPVARLTNEASIAGFNFSPAGEEIAVASRGQVEFWSTSNWERTRVATNFIGIEFVGVLFSGDGKSMWMAKDFNSGGLYGAKSVEPILLLPYGMYPLALDATGRYLAVTMDAKRLQIWDLEAVRKQLAELGLDWGGE